MKILVFDNYDSFTYNLVHTVKKIGYTDVDVFRNDAITLDEVEKYDKIILSPGPGIPSEAGLLLPLLQRYTPTKSILGVCLGHQAIGEVFGGELINLASVYHGVSTACSIVEKEAPLFRGLPPEILIGRYHSWIVDEASLPPSLQVTARDAEGFIMAMQHRSLDVQGVQFHPESVLTPDGEIIIKNWLTQPIAK